ncbi:MAG: (2Fe-2S)-binding protein [Desulfobacteraceae bacterium]
MLKKTFKKPSAISIVVNGTVYRLEVGSGESQVDPADTLAHTLRETLGLKGTKIGCDRGGCGACTVLLDGVPVLSCMTLAVECDGKSISTIEGLAGAVGDDLDPLQQAFVDHGAFQCGFCTPGIIMTAKAMLGKDRTPGREEVCEALSGHHCRCISHYQVVEAVLAAAKAGAEQDG